MGIEASFSSLADVFSDWEQWVSYKIDWFDITNQLFCMLILHGC